MKLIFLDGSGRKGSYNRKLLEAYEQLVRATGLDFEAVYISPGTHPVPNVTTGGILPAKIENYCNEVRDLAMQAHGFVIASPEYNGGPTGGLKNLIDWMTQPNGEHPKGNPFDMRPAVLLAASPGALGGIKGLQVMRLIMGHLRSLLMPEQIALGNCKTAFDDEGRLLPGLAEDLAKKSAEQLAQTLLS
ncbi:MAG: NADPH-dependent FMN reductase [Alphaproteobacteria bacterium]